MRTARQRVHVVTFLGGFGRGCLVGLERNDLEWNPEHFGDLFRHQPAAGQFVVSPPKPAAYDLFAEELGHERPRFFASSSKPAGQMGRPCWSRGQSIRPTVSSVKRIHCASSVFAWPVSVSLTTRESTRIVLTLPSLLRKPAMFEGGIPIGALFSASHSYTTLAIAVFLQTMMKTGGRGSSFCCSQIVRNSSHKPPSIVIGVFAHLRTASGFGDPIFPPRSAGVSCGRIQRQMLK